jgi:predicted nucleotidyltransferase
MNKTIEYRFHTTRSDRKSLLKLLDKGKNIYNLALSYCMKQLNKIKSDKEYTALLAERKKLRRDEASLAENNAQLQRIVKNRYFLTKNDIEKYVKEHIGYLAEGFNLQFAQVLADRAFDTIEKVLYGKAKNVRCVSAWLKAKGMCSVLI